MSIGNKKFCLVFQVAHVTDENVTSEVILDLLAQYAKVVQLRLQNDFCMRTLVRKKNLNKFECAS